MTLANVYLCMALAEKREKNEVQRDFGSRLVAARGDKKQVDKFQKQFK